jgi:HlyD family secretion protein
MTKKILNKKQKIVISIVAALLIIALGVTAYVVISKKTRTAVALADVTAGDITETLKLSGTVNSENQASFEILDGTYVKSVNVRVGDAVKKGDVLATFDTSSLSDVVAQKRENYNAAMSQYRKYASNANVSVAQLESLSKQIERKQREIEKLSEKVDAAKPKDDTKETISLKKQLTELLGDSKLAAEIVDRLFSSGTQVSEILQHLENIINGANNQISSILKLLSVSDEEKQLVSAQLELVELKARQSILKLQSGDTLASLYLSVAESAKEDLDKTVEAVNALKKGWVAENDGVVREINIVSGETYHTPKSNSTVSLDSIDISSLLSSATSDTKDFSGIINQLFPGTPGGIVVEYYPLSATFSVSGKDIYKIKLDQPVEITGATGKKFSGYVSFISPTASESASSSITSLLGSTSGGSEVEAKAMIEQPDKSIIIGLSVDMSIKLETQKNATLVPVESIQYEDGKSYIYLYDPDSKTVKKTEVTTGLFDGEHYQILSGCSVGDKIVKIPSEDIEDGQKIYAK